MTDDVTRRPWWRWMAGMRWHMAPDRGVGGHDLGRMSGRVDEMWRAVDDSGRILTEHDHIVPDPTDPATLGCLLALARELWGDSGAYVRPMSTPRGDVFCLYAMARNGQRSERSAIASSDGRLVTGATEWSALVAACDAAWGRGR